MMKEEIMKLLLEFAEKKNVLWFTKEEFFVWLWHRGIRMKFETVARYLRRFANEGLLIKRYRTVSNIPPIRIVEYYVNRYAIRMYLRKLDGGNRA